VAHDLAPGIQARGNLVVVDAGGSHQDHLGPNNLEVRQRIFGRPSTQLSRLGG